MARFFVEGDVIAACESGEVMLDPCDVREWAREKGFKSVEAYAQKRIDERNAFINLLYA
jgi:hypothetical protein